MSLRFIYGKAGAGKTAFCLSDIKEKLNDGNLHPLILLVPEQFTFEAEKSLLKTIKKDAMMRAQVLSFKTLANRIFTEVGGLTHKHMKSCGRAMLIYKIMEQVKGNLKVFSRASRQQGFIDKVSDIITELKRFEVTPEKLKVAALNIDNQVLKNKLEDISIIFSEFEDNLHEKYIDAEDEMTMLINKLEYSIKFIGAEFWIDGFTGFTPQQYRVIEKLLKKAKRVNVSLCMDTSARANDNTEVFAATKTTEKKLLEICRNNNIAYDEPVDLNKGIPARFKNSKELSFLEEHLFSYPYKEYRSQTEDISIFKAVNIYSEVEETARDIIVLVRDFGLRFSDITVATRDFKRYGKLISAIFSEYGIPHFIDQKRDIKNNPIIVFITSALEIYSKKWSYESVFRYLKTGLTDIDRDDICLIENYVLANGIRGSKWTEESWNYRLNYRFDKIAMEQNEKEIIEKVNRLREKIVGPLTAFFKKVSGKNRVKDICTALYDFLVSVGLPEKIEELLRYFKEEGELDTANQYSQVWDIVIDVLDQMVEVMGDDQISLERFAKIISIGFDEYKVGLIPPALDQVLISSIDRMKSHNAKALYIIGVNDGVFPAAITDEGIFTDSDRESLKAVGIELDHDTRTKVFEEQFLIYTALTSTSKFLRLSYPIADHEGRTMRPSIIISRVKKVFPKIKQLSNIINLNTRDENLRLISTPAPTFNEMINAIKKWDTLKKVDPVWLDVYRWYAKNDVWTQKLKRTLSGLYYTNQAGRIAPFKIKKLYGNKMYFSVSRLEKYSACPFAYFVQYGLKAKERKVYGFEALDLGTFMHNVLDRFSKAVEDEGLTWRSIDKEWCSDAISIIVDDMISRLPGYILNSTPKYKYLSERLKRILANAVWVIAEHVKRSSFEPVGHEVGFGDGEKYPPIKIILSTGEEINLIGRIDRVDIFEKDNEAYIRIIDYKSGSKSLDLTEIFYGLQLQLLIYLDAILESAAIENTQLNPAGILYFRIDDPIIKSKDNISDEEIQEEILKKLKMNGLVLNNADIIKEMDNMISGSSHIIPASINKDGNVGSRTSGATYEQFELLRKHVKNTIQKLCEDMLQGNIVISPYKMNDKTPCTYCQYSSVCQFDKSLKDNTYRIIVNKKDEEIFTMLRREVEANERE